MDEQDIKVIYNTILWEREQESDKERHVTRFFERTNNGFILCNEDAYKGLDIIFGNDDRFLKFASINESMVPYLFIGNNQKDHLIQTLLCNSDVEIWKEDPEGRMKNRKQYKLCARATPSNFIELDIYNEYGFNDSQDSSGSNVSDIWSQCPKIINVIVEEDDLSRNLFVGFIDTIGNEIGIATFSDNEIFSNLESLITQLNVREVFVKQKQLKLLNSLNFKSSVQFRAQKDNKHSNVQRDKEIYESLEKLVENINDFNIIRSKNTIKELTILFDLLEIMNIVNNRKYYKVLKITEYNLNQYLKIDDSVLRSLNIISNFTKKSDTHYSRKCSVAKNDSLFSFLNQCKTTQGSRLLNQRMRQPIKCPFEINLRLDLLEEFRYNCHLRKLLRSKDYLGNFPDLIRIIKKLIEKKSTIQDLTRLYQVVEKIDPIIQLLNDANSTLINEKLKNKLLVANDILTGFKHLIESTIDLEMTKRHKYVIKSSTDRNLLEIASRIKEIETSIQDEVNKLVSRLGIDPNRLKVERSEISGTFLRISRIDANSLYKSKLEGYIELGVYKNGVHFTTINVKRGSEKLIREEDKYKEVQKQIFGKIIEVVSTYISSFDDLNSVIAEIDLMTTMAEIASLGEYCRPSISHENLAKNGDSKLIMVESRHPFVESELEPGSFIPNNVEMNRTCSMFNIITGPNMGGKSTYIRQIGLIVIMAQMGCFVPCKQATIPIFDSIYTRIGSTDSQNKGISTFMMEMFEMNSILRSSNESSLIIIDELGRGTSEIDGINIAKSVVEYIIEDINAFTLFATHFHELSMLEKKFKQVQNLHVMTDYVEDTKEIFLLYKIEKGVGNESFGIHVAKKVGFPESVIHLAILRSKELRNQEIPLLNHKHIDIFLENLRKLFQKNNNSIDDVFMKGLDELKCWESSLLLKKQLFCLFE